MFVRRLLQEEGYTIAGARKRLRALGRDRVTSEPDPGAAREVAMRADLLALRKELTDLRDQLQVLMTGPAETQPGTNVTVTEAVPNTVPVRVRSGARTRAR